MELGKRYDFHSHTLMSDGELLVSEHVRRAEKMGYAAIAITDHADITNIDYILESIYKFKEKEGKYYLFFHLSSLITSFGMLFNYLSKQ